MGTINYTINSGVLPITVNLKKNDVTINTNTNSAYGSYYFTATPDSYTIQFVDSQGCSSTETIDVCTTCESGFTPIVGGCLYIDTMIPTFNSSLRTLVPMSFNTYGLNGMLLFDTYNSNGTGTYTAKSSTYWTNPGNTTYGPLNRSAVWVNTTLDYQDIAFQYCITIATEKTYYIGMGADNTCFLKLNGTTLITQDTLALETMVGVFDIRVPFLYWFIYPIVLSPGLNIIEVGGHNITNVAAVGIQIYDDTPNALLNATSDGDLHILFNSKSLVGASCLQEYSAIERYHGYTCPSGFALDTCDAVPVCVRRTEYTCNDTPAIIENIDSCYGLLYNHYAVTSTSFIYAANAHVPTDAELNDLNIYFGAAVLKEAGLLHWNTPNTDATNTTGFTLRPGGMRQPVGSYYNMNNEAVLWTSSVFSSTDATSYSADYDSGSFTKYQKSKKFGCSVRLIIDFPNTDNGNGTGTYVGNDGKVYPIVQLVSSYGYSKWWLAANLAETRYRTTGTLINLVTANADWANLTTAGICTYNNNSNYICIPDYNYTIISNPGYGLLYNFAVANASNIAPTGWRVPTSTDWNTLITTLGGSAIAGAAAAESGTEHWEVGNIGTNSSGFSAVGGGGRATDGPFTGFKKRSSLWSTTTHTQHYSNNIYSAYIYYTSAALSLSWANAFNGLGIRFIKNDSIDPGTVTDIDGNVYPTGKYGSQVWALKNSVVKHYNNGVAIPEVTSPTVWSTTSTGAWCYYNNNSNNQ